MTMDDTLKLLPIVILLFFVQFRLVNNVAHTKTKAVRNVDQYDVKKHYEDSMKLTTYDRNKRSPAENLDDEDEDIEKVSGNLRKKNAKQKRRRKKHRKGKKEQNDDDKAKEEKLSKAMTLEAERELGSRGVGNPCVASPCAHGGTCTWNREGQPGFRCDCRIGFQGRRCEREIEECESMPCKERGDCVATHKGFLCLCKDGYGGKFCEVSQKTHSLVPESYRHDTTDGVNISEDTLKTVYITVGVVGTLLGVIVLSLCIHSYRVWNERRKHTEKCKNTIENGGSISELPPDVCEISNAMCREFWCCSWIDLQGQTNQYEELLGEFRNSPRPDSPFPEMSYPQRLIQSEGALPKAHGSYRSFRSLPPKQNSFTKRPSWLPDVELSNDEDSMDSVNSPLASRTRPRGSSPSRKSFGTCPDLKMQMTHDGILSEDSLERMDTLDSFPQRNTVNSGDVSPTHYTSNSSQPYRHGQSAQSPSHPNRNRCSHKSPNRRPHESVFDKRASVRSILTHLSQTHPPPPHLPSDQSGSSSTF